MSPPAEPDLEISLIRLLKHILYVYWGSTVGLRGA